MPTATTKTRLNLRQGPGTEFPVIKILDQGTELILLEDLGSWLNVQFGEALGYVHENYVTVTAGEADPVEPAAPTGDTAPPLGSGQGTSAQLHGQAVSATSLRQGPSADFPELLALNAGDAFIILEDLGDWLNVQVGAAPGDTLGFVLETDTQAEFKLFGKTKTALNVRGGPGTGFPILKTLPAGATIQILEDLGDWLEIIHNNQTGFVSENFVDKGAPPPPKPAAFTIPSGPIEDVPLALPVEEHLPVNPQAPLLERLVADAWNRYGSLLKALSAQLGVDPAVAVAVLAVESGGRGFGLDGRMIIRFENHVFWDQWGKNNKTMFDQHFRFDEGSRWLGHEFRVKAKGKDWITQHMRSQDIEWQAFQLAETLNQGAARLSISMGGPQIMGFNYSVIGFPSVHAMYDAFSLDERNQVVGFFDFVKGTTSPSRRVAALQALDFVEFARLYNGSGQAQKYGGLIQSVFDIFHQLTGG